jgi:glycosyltransferase involved in cell wall biosynthesis
LVYYARSRHIDIVHAGFKPRDGFYAVALARLIGARSIVHLHCSCGEWMRPLTRWALAHSDGVLAVSEYVAHSAMSFAGTQPERVSVVRNGLELGHWDPDLDGTSIRREFDIPHDAPVIVAISRICPWKGLADLVNMLGLLRPQLPEARLMIVGDDDLGASPGRQSYTAELKRIAGDLGLEDRVIFTGLRGDVSRLLAASDVFALLNPDEGFGMVYLEAMAMRKPVIALAVGGPLEIIEPGKSGFLLEPGNVSQLATTVYQLLHDGSLRTRVGAYGRQKVEERFTMPLVAQDVLQIYEDLARVPLRPVLPHVRERHPAVAPRPTT